MNIVAGLLGFVTFLAGAFMGFVSIAMASASNAPSATTAAVLWCGGILIMVISGIRADMKKPAALA
jgi:hypothetical protein